MLNDVALHESTYTSDFTFNITFKFSHKYGMVNFEYVVKFVETIKPNIKMAVFIQVIMNIVKQYLTV